jgi:hypothetical protein
MDGCGRVRLNPITGQPTTFSYTGDACKHIEWFDSLSRDTRYLMGTGPFTMNSLDTQIIVMGAVIGFGGNNFQNVCNLQNNSDTARKHYYTCFSQSLIGAKSLSNAIPHKYLLYQNYPNPFNPITKIRFDIPKSSVVMITIYNSIGAEAIRLVDKEFKAGSHEVEWNGSEFPSGLYLLKLESGGFIDTKKMLLIK